MIATERTKYRVLGSMGWGLSLVAAENGRVMLRREYERAGYWHTYWRDDAGERGEPVIFHRHPNIPSIYEFGDEEGKSYTLQEPVYGVTLRTLSLGRRLPVERVVCVATCLCDVVGSLHGVTPCVDLAPHHVMLSVDGHVKLIGREERFLESSESRSLSVVSVNRLLPYLSPERLQGMAPGGGGAGDARSDVYSLGVSLWTWLVGENPHELGLDSRSQMAVIHRIVRRGQAGEPRVPSPRELRPDVPAWLDEVIMRAMSPDPADRFQTMQQMGEAILVLRARSPYRVEARPRQWADDAHQLGAENTECEFELGMGRARGNTHHPTPYKPFCAFCDLCGSPECDPGTHFGHTVLVGSGRKDEEE